MQQITTIAKRTRWSRWRRWRWRRKKCLRHVNFLSHNNILHQQTSTSWKRRKAEEKRMKKKIESTLNYLKLEWFSERIFHLDFWNAKRSTQNILIKTLSEFKEQESHGCNASLTQHKHLPGCVCIVVNVDIVVGIVCWAVKGEQCTSPWMVGPLKIAFIICKWHISTC